MQVRNKHLDRLLIVVGLLLLALSLNLINRPAVSQGVSAMPKAGTTLTARTVE